MLRAALCAPLCSTILITSAFAQGSGGGFAALADRQATAQINLSGNAGGMSVLSVDGQTSRLRLQAFFFRTAGMTDELNISALLNTGEAIRDTNGFVDERADTYAVQLTGPGFRIEPVWTLRGGLNTADVTEVISIVNTNEVPLVISFFQYSNFILSPGAAPLDTVQINGTLHNTVNQTGTAGFITETVVTPQPSHYTVGNAPALLGLFGNGAVDNMNDFAGPYGPDNVAWVYQWDFVIPVGGSVLISKDKRLVPEPGAVALVALGGLTAARRRRR